MMTSSTEASDGRIQNPFDGSVTIEPRSLVDRLAGRASLDLASKALEHLLATTDPLTVASSQVDRLLAEYGVKGGAASAVRTELWRRAIEHFLRARSYDVNARNYVTALRRSLNVSEDEALKAEQDLVFPRFLDVVQEAFAAGSVQDAKLPALRQRAADFGLSAHMADELIHVESEAAYKREWSNLAFTKNVRGEVVPRNLSRGELTRLRRVIAALSLTPSENDRIRLENEERLLSIIETGIIQPVSIPINLNKGERCVASSPAQWTEMRKAKSGAELVTVDSGRLYVTDSRFIFDGPIKTASIKYNSIISIEPFRDGMHCKKASGRSPFFRIPENTAFLVVKLAQVALDATQHGEELFRAPVDDPAKMPRADVAQNSSEATAQSSVAAEAAPRRIDQQRLEAAMTELAGLTGLDAVKREVESLVNLARVRALRLEQGLAVPSMTFHLVFTGRPGTGKTTVARIIGEVFAALAMLSKGHLVETDRSGLVAGYVGQTALKTMDALKAALGGILFIDEAYALAGRGDNDFGREAIETVLKFMEDHRDDFIVIVAGYHEPMETFLAANPGIRSRFNRFIDFPDYSPDELIEILSRMASHGGYRLTEIALSAARAIFAARSAAAGESFGNARLARNIFERAMAQQANRLAAMPVPSRDDLCTLSESDIPSASALD